MNRIRRKSVASGAAALAVLAVVATPPANGAVVEQHASATALYVDTPITSPIATPTVSATGTQGPVTDSAVSVQVPPLLAVNLLNVSAQTKDAPPPNCQQGPIECRGAFAQASAEAANVALELPVLADIDLPILGDTLDLDALLELTASVVKSECRLDAHNLLARTTILDADLGLALLASILGGEVVDIDATAGATIELPPNTRLGIEGVLEIILNEQIIEFEPTDELNGVPTADRAAVTVNGVHVVSELLDIDVIVSQANCEIVGSGPRSIDLSNSWNTGGSTIEVGAVVDGGITLPPLPLPEIIDFIDNLLPLPVQGIVDFVDQVVPLPVNGILNELGQGGMLNLDLNGLNVSGLLLLGGS